MPERVLPPNVLVIPCERGTLTRRVLGHYRDADPATVRAGQFWYWRALQRCRLLARQYGYAVPAVVAALAHLSPKIPWARNLVLLAQLLAGEPRPGPVLVRSWDSAQRALRAENPMATFGKDARKTFWFARAILGDRDAVPVDAHIGRALDLTEDEISTVGGYYAAFNAFQRGARRAGHPPRDLQAIVWVHVRGDHE